LYNEKGKSGAKKQARNNEQEEINEELSNNSKDQGTEVNKDNKDAKHNREANPNISSTISKVRNDPLLKMFWHVFSDDPNYDYE